jgi:hypothetical protein
VGDSREEAVSARGFTLLELLLATALVMVVMAVVSSMTLPLSGLLERVHAGADLETSARAALDLLAADLRQAGSGPVVAEAPVDMARLGARALPTAGLASMSVNLPGEAVHIRYVPHLGAQGRLAAAAHAGDRILHLDTTSRCAGGSPACGFRPRQPAAIQVENALQHVAIEGVAAGRVTLALPLTTGFARGAVLTEMVSVSYGLRDGGTDTARLVRLTSGGAEQPIVENVVRFEVMLDPPDPAVARRAIVALRIQAAAARFRGPAGALFQRSGTASNARHWVPDVELRTSVAFRNTEAP